MAEKSIIISAEEEAILLKPIDEYVGKIQEQIDALRVEGSDKVNSLKNQIAIAKENKNLTKEEQNKIIGECKKNLEKAKATEDANKQQIAKLIADAEGFLSKHYNSEYYNIVAKSCEAEKKPPRCVRMPLCLNCVSIFCMLPPNWINESKIQVTYLAPSGSGVMAQCFFPSTMIRSRTYPTGGFPPTQ